MFASRVILLLGAIAASSAYAAQQQSGPICATAPGTACSYDYIGVDTAGNDLPTTVNAFCGPVRDDGNSYCADVGARCQADTECYQNCGMTRLDAEGFGTCGGVGASCFDRDAGAPHDTFSFVCNSPAAQCSVDCNSEGNPEVCQEQGVCVSGASQAAAGLGRRVRRDHRNLASEARKLQMRRAAAFVARPGDEILS